MHFHYTTTILTAFLMHFSLIDWEVYFLFYNDKRLMSHHYSYIINKSGKSGIDQTFMTQACNSENAQFNNPLYNMKPVKLFIHMKLNELCIISSIE